MKIKHATIRNRLSPTEARLIQRLCDGETLLQISAAAGKSQCYSNAIIGRARCRLGLKTTYQLVAWFVRHEPERAEADLGEAESALGEAESALGEAITAYQAAVKARRAVKAARLPGAPA